LCTIPSTVILNEWQRQLLREQSLYTGTQVLLKSVDEVQRDDLKECDALVLGSPVHQRTMSWEMKRFIDLICEPSWFFDDMVGRVGGVFTTGGGHGDVGGGCELTQISLLGNLAALGMVIVPLPKTTPGFEYAGMHWGPHIRLLKPGIEPTPEATQPTLMDAEGLKAAFHHGANIARVAMALRDQTLMAQGNVFPSLEVRQIRSQMEGVEAVGTPR
jgi:NAD(P)H dehydrogenase (quinone)